MTLHDMIKKSLKRFPDKLKHFATGLAKHNIRYRIGDWSLTLPCSIVIPCKRQGTKGNVYDYEIVVYQGPGPSNLHLRNKTQFICIWQQSCEQHYFEDEWQATQHLIRILKCLRAWQKGGFFRDA